MEREEMRLFATNIAWDASEDWDCSCAKLPERLEIPKSVWEKGDIDMVSDYLSDATGFLHDGFCVESNWSKKEMLGRVDEIKRKLSSKELLPGESTESLLLEQKSIVGALFIVDDYGKESDNSTYEEYSSTDVEL